MVSSFWKKSMIKNIVLLEGCPCSVRQKASLNWFFRRVFSSHCPKTRFGKNGMEETRALLTRYGFDLSEASNLGKEIIHLRPKNIQSKLEFFHSIGIPSSTVRKAALRRPALLKSSLEKKIRPCYEYLRSFPVGNCNLIQMLRYRPDILLSNVNTCLSPNLELLRGIGVPMSSIMFLLVRCTSTPGRKHVKFKTFVNQLVALGMNPVLRTFVLALDVICGISRETWDNKLELFKNFGLSEEDIMLAFKKQPMIMAVSKKKLVGIMGFFVDELHSSPDTVFRYPSTLLLSLERRIMPRCRVMEVLVKNGMVKKYGYSYVLTMSEQKFSNLYVCRFEAELPELVDVYRDGKLPCLKNSLGA